MSGHNSRQPIINTIRYCCNILAYWLTRLYGGNSVTAIKKKKMKDVLFCFQFFKASPHLIQLQQHCFAVKLQKCFVDNENFTVYPSEWGWVENDWTLNHVAKCCGNLFRKGNRIYSQGNICVWSSFHHNASDSCCSVSVWTKKLDQQTDW